MLSNVNSDRRSEKAIDEFRKWCKGNGIDSRRIISQIQNDFHEACSCNPGHIIPIGEVYPGNWDGTAAQHIHNYAMKKNPRTGNKAAGANYLPFIVKAALLKDTAHTYTFYDNKSEAVHRKGRTRSGFLLILDDGQNIRQEIVLSGDLSETTKKRLRAHLCDEGRISGADVQKIKKKLGHKCEVCGEYDFEKHYGDLGRDFIELHHLYHRGKRKDGETVKIDGGNLREQFAVLCSNCHKMIHRLPKPKCNRKDVEILRKLYQK